MRRIRVAMSSGGERCGRGLRATRSIECLFRWMAGLVAVLLVAAVAGGGPAPGSGSWADLVARVQPKLVKIHGAGGLRGLEAYQSGILVSADGHVLTVLSYVLDADPVTVTFDDGQTANARLLGADPVLEIAVLKVDAAGLPHFDLSRAATASRGTPVLALSNLFGIATGSEALSVMHGWVAVRTTLAARHGAYPTPYRGPVYILDAVTSNPGVAGGAVVDAQGRLVGMLGKELRHQQNRTWLNYALPADPLAAAVTDIVAGRQRPSAVDTTHAADRPVTLAGLGIELVPKVLSKTPPFIDAVRPGSPAAAAGLQADDLVVYLGDQLIRSCEQLEAGCQLIERTDPVALTVLRNEELRQVTLRVERQRP